MVRFGMRDIDPKYLRNKTAHKLCRLRRQLFSFEVMIQKRPCLRV